MKVLVLGAQGMLGKDLVEIFAPEYEVIPWGLAEIDITHEKETIEKIKRIRPQAIINCAAYTDVDGCEANQERAFLVNAEGAKHVALASAAADSRLIHLSTDYVFNGRATTPYKEDSPTDPMSIYGQSKLRGEVYIRQIGGNHLIIRTAWLYGRGGRNFVEAILRQAAAGKEIRVVNDQRGSPTLTRDLSRAIHFLLRTGEAGIFHITNSGSCTWYEFALRILQEKELGHIRILPISSEELSRPAKRPAYSILNCGRYEQITQKTMRPWAEALQDYFRFHSRG